MSVSFLASPLWLTIASMGERGGGGGERERREERERERERERCITEHFSICIVISAVVKTVATGM